MMMIRMIRCRQSGSHMPRSHATVEGNKPTHTQREREREREQGHVQPNCDSFFTAKPTPTSRFSSCPCPLQKNVQPAHISVTSPVLASRVSLRATMSTWHLASSLPTGAVYLLGLLIQMCSSKCTHSRHQQWVVSPWSFWKKTKVIPHTHRHTHKTIHMCTYKVMETGSHEAVTPPAMSPHVKVKFLNHWKEIVYEYKQCVNFFLISKKLC